MYLVSDKHIKTFDRKEKIMKRRTLALVLTLLYGSTILTGCGAGKISAENLGQSQFKNTYDVYVENAKDGDYAMRTSQQIAYNYANVTDTETQNKLATFVSTMENYFAQPYDVRTELVISESNYENLKYMLDRYSLSNGTITSMRSVGDVYVVDVDYNGTRVSLKELPTTTPYIGIKGLYKQLEDDTWYEDSKFLVYVMQQLNKDAVDRHIMKQYSIDTETGLLTVADGEPRVLSITIDAKGNIIDTGTIVYDNGNQHDNIDIGDFIIIEDDEEDTDEDADTEDSEDEEDSISTNNVTETEEDEEKIEVSFEDYMAAVDELRGNGIYALVNYQDPIQYPLIPEDRRYNLNMEYITSIVGHYSLKDSANTDLFEDFNTGLGGRGFLANTGNQGLNLFEPSFANSTANITVRFYIRNSSDGLQLKTILPVKIMSNASYSNLGLKEIVVSDYVLDELQALITRYDRCVCNQDLGGMMSGTLIPDLSFGALMTFEKLGTVVSGYTTTISKVIAYDNENSTYLVECSRQYKIGGKSEGCTGTYNELVYMAIYVGADGQMHIVDELPVETSMTSEPYIEMSSYKEQINTNLYTYTGDVPTEITKSIEDTLDQYYKACNLRMLVISDERADEFGTAIGMNELYVDDRTLFNEIEFEKYTQRTQGNIVRGNGGCNISYEIVNFIGGSGNLVDVVVRETYDYDTQVMTLVEDVHYTFILTEKGWRVCGADVISTNNVVYIDEEDNADTTTQTTTTSDTENADE